MHRAIAIIVVVAVSLSVAGCAGTGKQKATAAGAGAGVGAATGAAVAHYGTSATGGVGALVGASVGVAGGLIAADHYYGSEQDAEMNDARAEAVEYRQKVETGQIKVQKLESELAREKGQQAALLKALEESRKELAAQKNGAAQPALQASVDPQKQTLTLTFQSEVFFNSGKARLNVSGKKQLHNAVLTIRKRFPNARIEVRGHTDNTPIRRSGFRSNWDLSCARAVDVVHALIEAERFKPEHMSATGLGSTQPVASNATKAGRAKNRRVELVVTPGK
jgi:flagellar motor protein MotB